MARYGFFPAPGKNYSVGDEPTLASRLNKLGQTLKLHLVGISGYRTPQHSVEVGGFPNDPHTQGKASDTPGIEGVPEKTLNRFGLTRPFSGAQEADHIQLLNSGTGGRVRSIRTPGSYVTPRSIIVAASVYGGPGDPSSGTHGYRGDDLTKHPDTFAELSRNPGALDFSALGNLPYMTPITVTDLSTGRSTTLYKRDVGAGGGGLSGHPRSVDVWYKAAQKIGLTGVGLVRVSVGNAPGVAGGPFPVTLPNGSPVTRPGGNAPGAGSGPDVTEVLTNWTNNQGVPAFDDNSGPFGLFKDLSTAVTGAGDFFKLLAWIVNPANILRMVEFLTGLVIMAFGFQAMLQAYGERKEGFTTSEGALSRSGLGRVSRELAAAVPAGRVAKTAKTASRASRSTKGESTGTSSRRRRIKPEAAPHRTRRQALRLRYEREKQVSTRRTKSRREGTDV